MKNILRLVLFILIVTFVTSCGSNAAQSENSVAVMVALTQTADALSKPTMAPTETPIISGTITGMVGLMAPPTPHMTVYAVETNTGKWTSTETAPNNEGAGKFTLTVQPGSYHLFAFTDNNDFSVFSADGMTLAPLDVAANQTVSNVTLRFPGQGDCGLMMGVPASPDGKFHLVPGPSADCISGVENNQTEPIMPSGSLEPIRVQFMAGCSSWSGTVDVLPNNTSAYVLYALKGQTMSVSINCDPANSGSFYIRTAGGIMIQQRAFTSWSFTLTDSQDYVVGVDNPTSQNIRCALNISIPPVSGASTDPVVVKNQVIRFATGPMATELNGTVIRGQRDRYTLELMKGENLEVLLSSQEANAAFSIVEPDSKVLPGTDEGKDAFQWSVPIQKEGQYAILVGPTRGNATYTLKVNVSGLP